MGHPHFKTPSSLEVVQVIGLPSSDRVAQVGLFVRASVHGVYDQDCV